MQHLLSSFILSLAINVDNFAVGIAYGIKKLRITIRGNLLIAFVSGVGTFISMSAGKVISDYLPHALANALGSGALAAFGIWTIGDTLRAVKKRERDSALREHKKERVFVSNRECQTSSSHPLGEFSYENYIEHPEKADINKSGYIELKESIALAFSLTINNVGCGVGAGISELSIVLTPASTFIFSLLGIIVGYLLGSSFTAKMSGVLAGIVSGCLILGLGGYKYFVNGGISQTQRALISIIRDESTLANNRSGTARSVNHGLSGNINGQLPEYLSQICNNKELTILILKAIGNASDPSFVRGTVPFISPENEEVGKSAVQVYRKLKDAHPLSILVKELATEKTAYVRKAIMETLIDRQPNMKTIGTIQRLLPKEKDTDVKYLMVKYLKKSKELFPLTTKMLKNDY